MPPALAPVLYVEDEENDALLMQLAFERAGLRHPLHVVSNGLAALAKLGLGGSDAGEHLSPALVLLDLNLPQMNGFEVLERLRESPEFVDLPVVVFSSSEQPSDKARAAELGAHDYVTKPSQLDGFIEVAKKLERTWLSEMHHA